jgi:hypothetical protein
MSQRELEAIKRHLGRHAHIFDLDQHGLGDKLLDIAADAILEYMDRELDPDGNRWDELSEHYADWKGDHFPGKPMAVLHGVMKTKDNLDGERDITRERAAATFGRDDQSRQEAVWFQEGYNDTDSKGRERHQPARPFYSFNPLAIARADQYLSRHFRNEV